MKRILSILIVFILLSPVFGELVRFSLFGFDLLPADILLPILLALWFFYKIVYDRTLHVGSIGRAIVIFIFILFLGFLINAFRFPLDEMARAGAYLVRFLMYMGLYFVVYELIKDLRLKVKDYLWVVSISAFAVAVLGFLQLRYFPSFLDLGLELEGWDPHDYRLLSTWFDPNFVAGFLAFAVALLGVLFFQARRRAIQFSILGIGAVLIAAIYFTYSRSGLLALGAVLLVWALFRSRRLLIGLLIVFLAGMMFSDRFQERVTSAWHSGQALIGLNTQYPLDPTAELRVRSWQAAREMIADHPWIGVGYNRYPYEVNQRGYLMLGSHASGGSDSSLLTLWATTGLVGLTAYLMIFVTVARNAVRLIRRPEGAEALPRLQGVGVLAALAGLFIHSVFVNSLLLPWMMIYVWSLLAVGENA